MPQLKDKVCVITGAAQGIGQAIAQQFLSKGATVVLVDRNPGGIEAWLTESHVANMAMIAGFDITDSSAVRSNLQEIKRHYGHIDVLVNNAGVERSELIGAVSEESMHMMFEVNAYGTILMTQYASRIMRQSRIEGSIINIASGVGIHGNPGQAVYAASKGAVIAFTRAAAKELGPIGIRVNAVAPGLTNTRMLIGTDEAKLRERVERVPLGRMAKPSDIAYAVAFLASDEASYISGQILAVDGSQIM